jgi:hypothetical protein
MARRRQCDQLMANRSLEVRVAAIEAQLAGKTLDEHFREQAELIDKRFAVRDAKWDARFRNIERDIKTLQSDVGILTADVGTLKADVGILKGDVGALKKDMSVVSEGISILLKRG